MHVGVCTEHEWKESENVIGTIDYVVPNKTDNIFQTWHRVRFLIRAVCSISSHVLILLN